MFKIDSPSAVSVMPTPAVAGTPGFFAHGNGDDVPYTVLTSDWANAVQAELCNVITAAGLTLDKTNQGQLLAAIQSLGRIRLSGNLNLYVSTSGNDSNNGLASGTPFLTIQKAWNTIVNKYDLNGYSAIINLANGTYTTGLYVTSTPVGYGIGGPIAILGNTTTPTSCAITVANNHAITIANAVQFNIAGVSLSTSGTVAGAGVNPAGILVQNGGTVFINGNMNFGSCASNHVWVGPGGQYSILHSYTISGGAVCHMFVPSGSTNHGVGPYTITLTGTPAFSGAFASALQCGNISCVGVGSPVPVSFSGSATGVRYSASLNGTIQTSSSGATYFPGGTSGSTSTGGQYA